MEDFFQLPLYVTLSRCWGREQCDGGSKVHATVRIQPHCETANQALGVSRLNLHSNLTPVKPHWIRLCPERHGKYLGRCGAFFQSDGKCAICCELLAEKL